MADIPELTEEQLEKAIPARIRKRLMQGRVESGEDIVALRRFVGLTQAEFGRAIEISVHTPAELGAGAATPQRGRRSLYCESRRDTRGSSARI